jgi:DNA recombination protein RmuC
MQGALDWLGPGATAGVLLLAAFMAGLLIGFLLAGSRRRLAAELLARQEAQRQAETEALLDGVKLAFGDISTRALRQSGEELMRLAQTGLQGERRLQGQQLAAERAEFEARIGTVLAQLERMQGLIRELERDRAAKFGELAARLEVAGETAEGLTRTTQALAAALTNSRVRGQWGERMAEDVLRLAGLVENVGYRRQAPTGDGRRRPDFTFLLPDGILLHMDVKFPFENWQRSVEAPEAEARARFRALFLRDVRARVREVGGRDYVAPGEGTLDFALLFIPNEQVMGAILESDPALIDEALRQGVVMVSSATLFAVLAIVRRASQNFRLSTAAREIAASLEGFRAAWRAYAADADRLGQQLDELAQGFQKLRIARVQRLDRQLSRVEAMTAGEVRPGEASASADDPALREARR